MVKNITGEAYSRSQDIRRQSGYPNVLPSDVKNQDNVLPSGLESKLGYMDSSKKKMEKPKSS